MANIAVPNIFFLGLLVLIFGSILRRRVTDQLQFWFSGWVLVLAHFVAEIFRSVVDERVTETLSVGAMELAGVLFLVAVSKVCEDRKKRWLLTLSVSLPTLAYTTAVFWNVLDKTLFYLLTVVAIAGVMRLVWSFYRELSTYVIGIFAGCIASGLAILAAVHAGAFAQVISLIECALFIFCAALYHKRFARWSIAVLISMAGFTLWGLSFVLGSREALFEAVMHASVATVASYAVALGLILTLLEEQIQEAQVAGEQIAYQAQHDALTGLPNRVLFEDRLSQALARARRAANKAAVLCIDLDRFKQVNDTFGHHMGDLYLKVIVERFQMRLRETDTLARTGGDEFSAVITDLPTSDKASFVAQELLGTLADPLMIEGVSLQGSASIGLAVFPDDGVTPDALRRAADQAMYWAKSRGRNRLECYAGDARDALDIEKQLRYALDHGKFELYYQPQFQQDGTTVALEALLRFRHPRLGMVPPSRFIPVAEESGLIVPIGDWVLEQVCRQVMEWQKRYGLTIRVAVNVSALQFGRADFALSVARSLYDTGVDPTLIELELTESLVMGNVQESARQMSKLKEIGVHLAVDDFGTGYSSLSYLHQLPIDTLKIDRSFIEKVSEPIGTRPIVEAIVSLAKTLNMRTVAEGVETDDQLAVVHHVGCDLVQGFLLSRPVPRAAVPDLLLKGAPRYQGNQGGTRGISKVN